MSETERMILGGMVGWVISIVIILIGHKIESIYDEIKHRRWMENWEKENDRLFGYRGKHE